MVSNIKSGFKYRPVEKCYGREGNDEIEGGKGDDTIYGGEGDDRIEGNSKSDILYGNEGSDALDGGEDVDTLYGGEGDDKLTGGVGPDSFDCGADTDIRFQRIRRRYKVEQLCISSYCFKTASRADSYYCSYNRSHWFGLRCINSKRQDQMDQSKDKN
jgi:hypothetical protein